ncbi:hypothetical protein WK94_04490 [Burkholderia ubonensis]|uniref:hypothetical protein n=1 Tax=Burkholderia ubonensis TaxID=101571 RepID=UPI00075D6F03|nr:hypothetical protein [Burkholderia ubonensis]KVW31688.1 hypothetical protein WK94_04490 [Burkholderia ubonensis]
MVDSDATLLFVVLKAVDSDPVAEVALEIVVDSEFRPVDNELIPVEVDVDSDATLLFVALKPVDSDATLLFVALKPVDSELSPVDVDVESELIAVTAALSCEPLIASVLVDVTCPAATFVICRVDG